MTQKHMPILRPVISLIMVLVLALSLLPVTASATNYEGSIEITGTFQQGKFKLDSSDMELFALKKVVPGDSWTGKVHVTNKTGNKMEVRLLSIESNIEDLLLYDGLDLDISVADDEVYTGSYGATEIPVSKFYELSPGETVTFDIHVSLSVEAGNEYQGKKMDSTWTFEARLYESGGGGGGGSSDDDDRYPYEVHYVDKEGNELHPTKHGSGELGEKITEYAVDIPGYTPDAEKKSIIIKSGDKNIIVFIYEQVEPETPPADPDTPDEPTDPEQPEGPKEDIQTGVDMTESNTSNAPWLFVLVLSIVGACVIIMRLNAAKAEAEERKRKYHYNYKEDSSNGNK